jgi:hypothetical protein
LTSYGVPVDIVSLLAGVIVLVAVVVLFGSRRGESGLRFYAFSAVKVVIFFLFWQILWVVLIFLTYRGGTIYDILLKWQLANLAAFIIALSAAIVVEIRFTLSDGI